MIKIKTVGIIGAGTMGSALAQKFAQEGFSVILADREMKYVEDGKKKIAETLNQGIERKLFTREQADSIISNISGTDKLTSLQKCDLITEAIFEDFNAKSSLFKELNSIVDDHTVIATNTSSFSVTELSGFINNPGRFIGMHYFYHAAKNRLVEIIPGEKTSPVVYEAMKTFTVKSGKDAITTKDSYGFAVNRFFVPWLNEAVRILEEKISDAGTIDYVCKKVFGIGMGPFALMNATGVPIAYHAQKTLEVLGDFYKTSELLAKQAESKKDWVINEPDENFIIDAELEKEISERMLGCVYFVCSQILEEKVCTAAELNRGAKIGLRWRRGPVELMKRSGEEQVSGLVNMITKKYEEKVPGSINKENWQIEYVNLKKRNNLAIIEMARPEDMNALNEEVVSQLSDKFNDADKDESIDTILIYGLGKAFVAGADIKFFVNNIKNHSIQNIESFTKFGQEVYQRIDSSRKKVVAVLNGMALGGGLELALCADVILALPKAVIAFPETGIGIYPGLGGTQRTAKKTGKGLTKYLVYTGTMLNALKAGQIGLVDKVIGIDEFFEILEGNTAIPEADKSSLTLNAEWTAVEEFFNKNKIKDIRTDSVDACNLPEEQAVKFCKIIKRKAPIALEIAERLIDEAGGPESELGDLNRIFSTNDALLGLTSIGKRVEFSGN
jgi:enoyl-CoA hydratase/3-hydroxyacyl-CoA dehydrogenase